MSGEMIRAHEAKARFGVSEDTLRRWADAGLVGRSRLSRDGRSDRGRIVKYCAADIERLQQPEYATPKRQQVRAYRPAPASEDWRNSDLWRGVVIR